MLAQKETSKKLGQEEWQFSVTLGSTKAMTLHWRYCQTWLFRWVQWARNWATLPLDDKEIIAEKKKKLYDIIHSSVDGIYCAQAST